MSDQFPTGSQWPAAYEKVAAKASGWVGYDEEMKRFNGRVPTYADGTPINVLNTVGIAGAKDITYHYIRGGMVSGREFCMMKLAGMKFYLISFDGSVKPEPYIYCSRMDEAQFRTEIERRCGTKYVSVRSYTDPTTNDRQCTGPFPVGAPPLCVDIDPSPLPDEEWAFNR